MPQQQVLTDHAHEDFIAISTLLSLIDPVRGSATIHDIDKHPDDNSWMHDNLQKKFLESFALICSTAKKGGETASAVCLEQSGNSGTILRLARNLGVPIDLISRLQEILECLQTIPRSRESPLREGSNDESYMLSAGPAASELEKRVLYKIVELDKEKITSLFDYFRKPNVRQDINSGILKLRQSNALPGDDDSKFRDWIGNLERLASIPNDVDMFTMMYHIKWASEARWVHSEQLRNAFSDNQAGLPKWVYTTYKLGRYHVATQAMIKFAFKRPNLFTSIHVEAIEAPAPKNFSLKDGNKLNALLKKISKNDVDQVTLKLGQIWQTNDPSKHFRQKCRHGLTVHAEMQLISFYDQHPELIPRLLFMGTSKKACYLCYEFLSRHPLRMTISACHQKLYPSWVPDSPCSKPVREKHKNLLWHLKSHLEKTVARELQGGLDQRRPPNLDSTAGPSLTLLSNIWSLSIGGELETIGLSNEYL